MVDESGTIDQVAAVGALGDPTCRALYGFIATDGDWVSRDRAADVIGIERGTAAHHLERLAADGLLDVDYQRLTGRQGPGAGRPAKVYRRSRRDFEVSLPPRDYELAGQLLAEAAERAQLEGSDIVSALGDVAAEAGHRMGEAARSRLPRRRPGRAAARRAVVEALSAQGFEPATRDDGTVVLRNCPFHNLARRHTELICGMNHDLVAAAAATIAADAFDVRLEPADDACCVRLHLVS